MVAGAGSRLGAQLWVERDSGPAEVDELITAAVDSGLGELRIFLVWPWIEPQPDAWFFELYDSVFDSAAEHGLKIKATLSPETPPWHRGGQGFVQSRHLRIPGDPTDRCAVERYLRRCVSRYRDHPALGQWLLWNEPFNPTEGPNGDWPRRDPTLHSRWVELLRRRYDGDIGALNRRWLTGYADFDAIDFPEEIPHPAHRDGPFFSFDPWLAEATLRADTLVEELRFVRETIRAEDPDTPTCLNPPDLFRNHAAMGYDFAQLGRAGDVLGASVHAPWHLAFAPRRAHLGLAVTSVRMLAEAAPTSAIELTEIQTGNVLHGSPNPLDLEPDRTAAWYLAPILAGAQSVAGWSLNCRSRDFEAGDWGLLNDDNSLSDRSRAVVRVRRVLDQLEQRIGADWSPERVRAIVGYDERSQAVTLVHSWTGVDLPGRGADDAIHGVATIAQLLNQRGIAAAPASVSTLGDHEDRPDLVVLSHLGACAAEDLQQILRWGEAGTCLLVDGTTGQKDLDGQIHRPWPTLLSEKLGYHTRGMITRSEGHRLTLFGTPIGRAPLAYADLELSDPAWTPDPYLLLPDQDHRPVAWTRPYGAGHVIVVAAPLGPALAHDNRTEAVLNYLIGSVAELPIPRIRPLTPDTIALTAKGSAGEVIGVFGPTAREREGRSIRVQIPIGRYDDLWSGATVTADRDGVSLETADGIALLCRDDRRR